ncbi:MAG: hypothetical protein LUQ21_05475 [Methanothrix sp.]|nr:hypothetical protein [Methanothrix sp.]
MNGGNLIIICECGEIVDDDTFRDYIKTSANPSTPTIGHKKCGHIFNFIDGKMPRRYSSKKELKSLAMKYAERRKLTLNEIEHLLVEVDRLKSSGNLSDGEVLNMAFRRIKTSSFTDDISQPQ